MRASLIALFFFVGCAPATDPAEAGWQGTRTVDGSRTIVSTTHGSVWGENAELVEEASIGVVEGDDPYMLGLPRSVTAGQGRIVIADEQVPAVRVYDWDGRYLHDLGRAGEGPGEFALPQSVRMLPDGRVAIRDDERFAVHLYRLGGEYLETWPSRHRIRSYLYQLSPTTGGELFTPASVVTDRATSQFGMHEVGPAGLIGNLRVPPDFGVEPVRVTVRSAVGGGILTPREFPQVYWALDAQGRFVAGLSSAYRFERHSEDGNQLVVVRDDWEPVPVTREEAAAARDRITAWAEQTEPGWTWDLPPIPSHKQAFRGLVPSLTGEIWVLRPGPGHRTPDCVQDDIRSPCWTDSFFYDVFDSQGRFLGSVPAPDGLVPDLVPHIDGTTVVAIVQDETGVSYVKRFRVAGVEMAANAYAEE